MQSSSEKVTIRALPKILRPIVRLLLNSGSGYREFSRACKTAFVDVATEEFGIRGRPTNVSRVAVMTGLTRKEVKKIRDMPTTDIAEDLWGGKLNPPTEILHNWHSDSDFCNSRGQPKVLAFSGGEFSFSTLVRRYAGDIPAGAMRVELKRAGAISEDAAGMLFAEKKHYTPVEYNTEFVNSMAFSLSNLASTLVHNAALCESSDTKLTQDAGRLERYVWTSGLSSDDVKEFKKLAEIKAHQMLLELDTWVGHREQQHRMTMSSTGESEKKEKGCGLGIYFFEGAQQ